MDPVSDPELTVAVIRMLERLAAVAIGGLTIYLGYRLFHLLPTQTSSDGKIELPGYSVVLSRVGPGIFFLAFGSILLYQSVVTKVWIGPDFIGAAPPMAPAQEGFGGDASERFVPPQELARTVRSLQVLNCAQDTLEEAGGGLPEAEIERAIRSAKLALMEASWAAQSWGGRAAFVQWVNWNEGTPHPEARAAYEAIMPGCGGAP